MTNHTKSRGYSYLKKHENGERLTRDQAIKAKCCECSGYYDDGRFSCEIPDCPLFPFMPYREKYPKVAVIKEGDE